MVVGVPGARAVCAVIAISLAYVFAVAVLPPPRLPAEIHITITATGEMNPESKGAEVWVIDAPGLDPAVPHPGWERRDNGSLVSYSKQPARLSWSAKTGSTKDIILHKHPYSGVVEVAVGTFTKSFDLYSPSSDTLKISVPELAWKAFGRNSMLPMAVFLACLALLGLTYRRFSLAQTRRTVICHVRVTRHAPDDEEASDASPGNKLLSPAALEEKASLLVLASCAVAANTILENRFEMGPLGGTLTFGWFLLVLWGELVLLGQLHRVFRPTLPVRVFGDIDDWVLLLLFLVNLYCTFLFAFTKGTLLVVGILLCAGLFFAAALFASRFEPGRNIYRVFLAAFAFALVSQKLIWSPAYQIDDFPYRPSRDSGNGLPAASVAASSGALPNIYFLSLDALASRRSMRELFEVNDLKLWSMLEQSGFRLRDTRSPGRFTKQTFYKIFTLQQAVNVVSSDFLLGFDDNPIINRLKTAHYNVQSIQGSAYLGILNNYWDYYFPSERPPFDYCWSITDPVFFFGLCAIPKPRSLRNDTPVEHIDRLAARIRETAASGAPWFTFAHVLSPSHTDNDFHYADRVRKQAFLQRYLLNLDELHGPFQALLADIKRIDPNSLIIIHGDHGPWLTRGWSKESDQANLYDDRLVELDRRSVLLAVYPKDFCTERLDRIDTTADVLPAVFECLNL